MYALFSSAIGANITVVSNSHSAFGTLSKGRLFIMDSFKWAPRGFCTWVSARDKSPGMVNLRENKKYVHEVARKLIEDKREELKNGAPRRDLLSLLGSSCVPLAKSDVWY